MARTSDNTIFTLRALRPLVCPRHFEEWNQADNPALAKSVGHGAIAP
ncbi:MULTISPECIES: hypothetical protein [unclassified Paenibacillus]|nr:MULTISPECIES: hypothetical protein [unclassified Paenibacillus]